MGKNYTLEADTGHLTAAGNAPQLITTSQEVIGLREEIGSLLVGRTIAAARLGGGDLRSRVVDVQQLYLNDGTVIDFWPYMAGRYPSISLKKG